ncbi:hypothetical protein [Maritalea mediterranea]|uniref:Transglycosylase SLT domain-containing protein n=1 Tax=Maritalea mediterranea TaxID=2909667 RepID=A0ABS9E7A5_9HYPH|nr:hypothetical protein [Maritalea mediterranea]MCF4098717.1 hypothetical protein [Maritalea mediterranea]
MPTIDPNSLSPELTRALTRAGDKNGVDFGYLLQTAMRESSLDPEAKAATSSAVGLFQFLEGTWLEVIKEEGPKLGYGDLANKIRRSDRGYEVINPQEKSRILALREDPEMAADLAAAFTRRNGDYLKDKFGRMPSPGELYIAHFLGAGGAEKLFELGLEQPNAIAADHFGPQARANRSIFYKGDQPRTIKEVYQVLVRHHAPENADQAAATQFAAQQMALDNKGPFAVRQPASLVNPFESLYRPTGVPSNSYQTDDADSGAKKQSFFSSLYKK